MPRLPKHIRKSEDLQTSHASTVRGFLEQAVKKTEKASPLVQEALNLEKELANISSYRGLVSLLRNEFTKEAVIGAAGFSAKAVRHMSDTDLSGAIEEVAKNLRTKGMKRLRLEIVYRFLLTRDRKSVV
jgi:hypothetical protein